MAVYTKINRSDLTSINRKFNIENTNYLLRSKNKKFILTIFEKRVVKKEIPFFMKLMDQLSSLNINCPKPLKNNRGNYLIKVKNKIACVVSFLDGKDKKKLNFNWTPEPS